MSNSKKEKMLTKISIEAKKYNLTLISDYYYNSFTPLLFLNESGQEIELNYKSFCKKYTKNKIFNNNEQIISYKNQKKEAFLLFLKQISFKNKAILLSKEWNGAYEQYLFKDYKNEEFSVSYQELKRKGFPIDHVKIKKTDNDYLFLMEQKAKERGGRLISKKWLGAKHQYEFEDVLGCHFFVSYDTLMKGSWVIEGLVTEPCCRQAMEFLFQHKFEKTREVILAKQVGTIGNLEFDGYSDVIKVAFEYQGHRSHWDLTHKLYEQRTHYDKLKRQFCQENNIILVIIPLLEKVTTLTSDEFLDIILTHVKKAFNDANKPLPKFNLTGFQLDLKSNNHSLKMLYRMKKIAMENRGDLLSTEWKGSSSSYLFITESGIQFEATHGQITDPKKGWIKNVENHNKTELDRYNALKKLAEEHNITLLENKWLGAGNNHRFEYNGKEFLMRPSKIKYRGFPKNMEQYLTTPEERLQEFKEYIELYGATLLEDKWLGIDYKHKAKLSSGHEVFLTPYIIYRDGWIKNEAQFIKTKNDYLEWLRKVCLKNDAQLLSTKWIGNNQYYKAKLKTGDIVEIMPIFIQKHGWYKTFSSSLKDSRYFINFLSNFAKENNAFFIDNEWYGSNFHYQFMLSDNQFTLISYSQIKNLGWPKKIKLATKAELKYQDLKKIAYKNKGTLISTQWIDSQSKYIFAFKDGREFIISYNSLKKNGWPKDADEYLKTSEDRFFELKLKAEQSGYVLLEEKWLGWNVRHHFRNSDNIDYYQSPDKIGTYGFPKNLKAYLLTNKTDEEKLNDLRIIAEKNGGQLISDKWYGNNNKYHFKFESGKSFYILAKTVLSKKRGWPKNEEYYFSQVKGQTASKEEKLNDLKSIAEQNGGKILSTEYQTRVAKILCQFEDGREFETTPAQILTTGWPKDANAYFKQSNGIKNKSHFKTGKHRLDYLSKIAKENNAELLSTEWIGTHKKYKFKFFDGREFETYANRITRYGFPKDADEYFKRVNCKLIEHIDTLKQIAIDNGGQLVSTVWTKAVDKYDFLYSDGTPFSITYQYLKSKGWPKNILNYLSNSGKNHKTNEQNLEEIRKIGEKFGATLLSNEWFGHHKKYKFKKDNHILMIPVRTLKERGWPKSINRYIVK